MISRSFPSMMWASDIEVEVSGPDLLVHGDASFPDQQPERDLLRNYREWAIARTMKRAGLKAPQIRFANAITDQLLIAFVKTFGPVYAESVAERDTDNSLVRDAIQPLDKLRCERRTYAAALDLLVELEKEKAASPQSIQDYISGVVEGCKDWTSEWHREREWRRARGHLPPSWHFDKSEWENLVRLKVGARQTSSLDALSRLVRGGSPSDAGHQVICTLANAFSIEVTHFGNTRCEVPPRYGLVFGVRPVLYHLLRLEYLRTGVQRCVNEFCRQFFLRDREGQHYCSEECSRKHRQREYWKTSGSKLRRKRNYKKEETLRKLAKGS